MYWINIFNTFFEQLCGWTNNSGCKCNKFFVEFIRKNCKGNYGVFIFKFSIQICFRARFTYYFRKRHIELSQFFHAIWKNIWRLLNLASLIVSFIFWLTIRSLVIIETFGTFLKRFKACIFLLIASSYFSLNQCCLHFSFALFYRKTKFYTVLYGFWIGFSFFIKFTIEIGHFSSFESTSKKNFLHFHYK